MNQFEQSLLEEFVILCIEDYTSFLKESRSSDFSFICKVVLETVPFSVYNSLWKSTLEDLSLIPEYNAPLCNILKNAYYYAWYSSTQSNEEIKSVIENAELNNLIEGFSEEELFGTAIMKACINYLYLIDEDVAYKDIIEEDIKQSNKESVLDKLKEYETPFVMRTQLLRNILYDIHIKMIKEGYSQEEVYLAFDSYFNSGVTFEDIMLKYEFLLEGGRIPTQLLEEQRRIIYQTAFIGIQTGSYEISNFDVPNFIKSISKSKPTKFPKKEDARYAFYQVFLSYYYNFNIDEHIKSLDDKDVMTLKNIYPLYYLDCFGPSSSLEP